MDTEWTTRSTHRDCVHIQVEQYIYPVFIHVELENLKWFEEKHGQVVKSIVDSISRQFGEIEQQHYEHSPQPAKHTTTPNYSISPMKRIGVETDTVLTAAVMRRRPDDYSIVMPNIHGYQDMDIGLFSIYVWIKPKADNQKVSGKSHLSSNFCEYPHEFALPP